MGDRAQLPTDSVGPQGLSLPALASVSLSGLGNSRGPLNSDTIGLPALLRIL